MSDNAKSFLFAGVMCVVVSLLLTAASSGLKERQLKNMQLDKNMNILKSVNLLDYNKKYKPKDIQHLYSTNIQQVWINNEGDFIQKAKNLPQNLSLYLYMKDKKIKSYIIPIESRGLWGKIYGYLALENDGSTVSGFTVYKHSETPGLGGEIEKQWFQKNFQGKKIISRDGEFVSLSVAKGKAKDIVSSEKQDNYVDGISGATLTGKFLTGGLKEVLQAYESVSVKFRRNLMPKTTGDAL